MKRTVVGIVVAGCMGLPLAACSAPSQPTSPQRETHALRGYPIDRTLNALVTRVDLDSVVIVEGLQTSAAVQLSTSDKSYPAVVTPATTRVAAVLFGQESPQGEVKTVFGGGQTATVDVKASKELAPDLAEARAAKRLVLAGEFTSDPAVGEFLDPLFVYALTDDGILTSLLESGSNNPYPSFTLAELQAALAKR